MSDIEILKAALESAPDWEAVRDGNEALARLLSAARAEGRKEGFEKAREMAATLCDAEPKYAVRSMADAIRAMRDGEGP